MTRKSIVDSFHIENAPKWDIDESSEGESVVDGVNILGRAVGPFFMVGESRNKRVYSEELWNRAINENTDRLKNGTIIGTIGHTQKLDDQALLEGKASHRVSKLWLNEDGKTGMGEVLIFNTSAGRELNALLRGGMQLSISSRAAGEYKGRTSSGSQIIDPDSFVLEGFDFVQTPGVPGAVPVLVEHLADDEDASDLPTNNLPTKSNTMSNELMESLAKDKINLQNELSESLDKLGSVTRERDALVEAHSATKADRDRLNESVAQLTSKVVSLEESIKATEAKIAVFEELGTPDEISEAIDAANALVEAYKEHGSPEELTEAFEGAVALIETYAELGKPEEIEKVLDIAETYAEIGTPEAISEAQDLLESYQGLGSVDDIKSKLDLLEQYEELGSVDDINKAFDLTEGVINKMNADKNEAVASEISKKFSVETKIVEGLLEKHGKEETVSILETLKGESVGDRYKTSEAPAINEDNAGESVNEGLETIHESRAARMMRNQNYSH